MAILSRDDYIKRVKGIINDDTSENAVSFMEDMIDTYDEISSNSVTREEMNNAVTAKEEEWRKKYIERFEGGYTPPDKDKKDDEEDRAKTITIEELFKHG